MAGLLDDAIALAQTVLRADAAADLRHVVGARRHLVGFLEAAFGGQHQPVGNVVLQRAVDLAVGNAALRAAPGLSGGIVGVEFAVDFVEIAAAVGRVALVGHALPVIDELQHLA